MDMPAAFAGVAARVSRMTGGPYVDGQVIDETPATIDDGGSIIAPGAPTYRSCQVQIDAADQALRDSDGYVERDMRFLVLAATLTGPLDTDARVTVFAGPHAGEWEVSAIQRDAMGVYWGGRGRAT